MTYSLTPIHGMGINIRKTENYVEMLTYLSSPIEWQGKKKIYRKKKYDAKLYKKRKRNMTHNYTTHIIKETFEY